jgi:putative transposase
LNAKTPSDRTGRSIGAAPPSDTRLQSAPTEIADLGYPFHDKTVTVTTCGRICFNLNTVFAGQLVGIEKVSDEIWLGSFMDYDLGYFDYETCRLEPIENPFRPKVLPVSPE